MWELLFLATIMAFLAFMTLKYQNTEFLKQLTPNGPNYQEKSLTFHIFDPVAFKLTFTTFVGLFQFLWDLLCFPLVCKIVKSMQETYLPHLVSNRAPTDYKSDALSIAPSSFTRIIAKKSLIRAKQHYGQFGQNLSKNSIGVFFALI